MNDKRNLDHPIRLSLYLFLANRRNGVLQSQFKSALVVNVFQQIRTSCYTGGSPTRFLTSFKYERAVPSEPLLRTKPSAAINRDICISDFTDVISPVQCWITIRVQHYPLEGIFSHEVTCILITGVYSAPGIEARINNRLTISWIVCHIRLQLR